MKKCKFWFTMICFLYVAFLFSGCATVSQAPRTVYNLKINPNSSTKMEKDNVVIEIRPITMENYKNFPKMYTTINYSTKDGRTGSTEFTIADFPAFELMITNKTGHIIRFSKAVIKLQDNNGEMIDPKMKMDLVDAVDSISENYRAQGINMNVTPVKSKIRGLKIIDKNFELLPDITEKAYVTFNIPQESQKDYEEFLSSKQYLKVMLYEIPVEMTEAGEVKRTTNFEFIFDVVTETIQPAATK